MSNYLRCGCEDGRDCTKTTMCHVQTAVEDYESEIERLHELLDARDKERAECINEIERLRGHCDTHLDDRVAWQAEIERLKIVLDACILSNKEYEQANNELTEKIAELQRSKKWYPDDYEELR